MKAIDVHLHCSDDPGDFLFRFADLNGLKYNLSELLELMKKYEVTHGLLLSPPKSDNTPIPNNRIVELCSKSNGMLSPVLTIEPSTNAVEEGMKLAIKLRGLVKGFKIRLGYIERYAYDNVFDKLYDFAESEELPVMFHTGDTAFDTGSLVHSHPLTLDRLANVRQELKIVISHFGNPWIDDTAELIYKHQNVYTDISGLVVGGSKYSGEYVKNLVQRLNNAVYFAGGADKILFGTDYPVETFEAASNIVHKLEVSDDDKQKILYSNAKEVFSL